VKLDRTWRGRISLGALLVLGVLAIAAARELTIGARGIEEAERALSAGDHTAAIAAGRRAAEARLPGSPYPERAYALLERIAREAEARGDDETSNAAWRAVRAAALETRGALADRFRVKADEGLTRVGARVWAGADAAKLPNDVRPSERELAEQLGRDDTPPPITFAGLAVAVLTFFGGVGWLLWLTGGHRTNALTWRAARIPAIIALAGLLLWVFVALR
jgi:hypothetical protein